LIFIAPDPAMAIGDNIIIINPFIERILISNFNIILSFI